MHVSNPVSTLLSTLWPFFSFSVSSKYILDALGTASCKVHPDAPLKNIVVHARFLLVQENSPVPFCLLCLFIFVYFRVVESSFVVRQIDKPSWKSTNVRRNFTSYIDQRLNMGIFSSWHDVRNCGRPMSSINGLLSCAGNRIPIICIMIVLHYILVNTSFSFV